MTCLFITGKFVSWRCLHLRNASNACSSFTAVTMTTKTLILSRVASCGGVNKSCKTVRGATVVLTFWLSIPSTGSSAGFQSYLFYFIVYCVKINLLFKAPEFAFDKLQIWCFEAKGGKVSFYFAKVRGRFKWKTLSTFFMELILLRRGLLLCIF